MEHLKIINLLDNNSNQPSKFTTRNWVEITVDSPGTYNTNSQIEFKTLMLNWSLFYYNDEYILVIGNITITGDSGQPAGRTETQIESATRNDEKK